MTAPYMHHRRKWSRGAKRRHRMLNQVFIVSGGSAPADLPPESPAVVRIRNNVFWSTDVLARDKQQAASRVLRQPGYRGHVVSEVKTRDEYRHEFLFDAWWSILAARQAAKEPTHV